MQVAAYQQYDRELPNRTVDVVVVVVVVVEVVVVVVVMVL